MELKSVGYDFRFGEGRSAAGRVQHPIPVGLSDDEADVSHPSLRAALLDIGPTHLSQKRKFEFDIGPN